jgi:acetyltransferase
VLASYPSDLTHAWEAAGELYRLRAVRPTDEPAVIQLLESLDPEAIRMRFFGYIRHFTHAMAARMTQIDYDRELSLVIVPDAQPDKIVGMGTLVADASGACGEFAILVHGDHGGRGLGKHLLQEFVRHARKIGVRKIVGETLAENRTMQSIARQLGFTCRPMLDDPGCIHMEIAVG